MDGSWKFKASIGDGKRMGNGRGKKTNQSFTLSSDVKNCCTALALFDAHQSNSAVSSHSGAVAPARLKALFDVAVGGVRARTH